MVPAFRLYGDFHWPPHPDADELSAGTEKGIIEIRYAEKDGVFRPLLRWIPGEITEPSDTLPAIKDSIFNLTPEDAVNWFAQNAATDCAIWIDDGKNENNIDWVAFRGAFLIDQYKAAGPDEKATLDLRWPLVRACEYAPGEKVFSTLNVGRREGNARFVLNLHLPLPARRTTLFSGSNADAHAFPFCAVYQPFDGKFRSIPEFTTLVGGWIRGDAVDTSKAKEARTSFVFAKDKYPSAPSLGAFGFAARGLPSQGDFAVYEGMQADKHVVQAARYWPTDSRPFTEDILTRYGFSIDRQSAHWPPLTAGASTSDLSLRFPRHAADPRNPAFVYRIAVSASGPDPKSSDDIKSGSKGLALRLLAETGGWITTAATLYADCRLTWSIPDNEIWSTGERRWSPKVDVSFHWKNRIPATDNFGDGPATRPDLDFGLLRHAAHSFRQAREALKPVEAGQPQSALPDLRAKTEQTVLFTLYGPPLDAHFLPAAENEPPSGLLRWGRPEASETVARPFIRPRMRLTLARRENLIEKADDTAGVNDNGLVLLASGQTFFNAATSVELTLSCDEKWLEAGQHEIADGEPFFASYVVKVTPPSKPWSGRLSSLKFDWSPPAKPSEGEPLDDTYLRAGGPGRRDGMNNSAPPIDLKTGRIAASIHLRLPVSDVVPISVDVARMDRSGRPAPLLIPEGEDKGKASGERYWLGMKETIAPTQDRFIEADIYESASETGERSYVVLSQEPFSIFRYMQRPLSDRGDLGSASVAYYSGDDRVWQYRKVADHYHYILPPQAVGESADKPRRLEIHDLAAGIADDSPEALRPYVEFNDDGAKKEEGKEIPASSLKRRAVEFKLTPSTEFWIRPSDVERGYFMPESAAYEIFRQRGEYGLGAALAFLRGEFLYGLSVGINVSKESSISRQARVAEIEALTGRITGPARDADAEKNLNARWNALSRAVARRPERLEVWARDPDSTIEFTPARFADGVTYALRGTALHRPPLEALEQPDDLKLWPKIGRSKADPENAEETIGPNAGKPRSHPQGLSGGALWPVESVNLFNELLERPESSGGAIESIALSPIGGDAVQKAAFLGGIVTIISETRNGHVERQKVEVLGRIGAFWHRAKHVVVYERTVNASAQFAPKFEEDLHHTRSRRPILRKVREYIELLEHERSYPDFAEAVPRCTGFLERVCFNSKIINVDSAWSSEVGDYGWKIPLWNLLSARERPQVYSMPDVAFVSTAEGDGDSPTVAQECLDTDNLFFFSDFKANTSNTNAWKTRLAIDYANMPTATSIAKHADAKSAKDPGETDGRCRSVSRILTGTRRFTWRLAAAAQKTAINAGRAGKPVYVGLDSVSFMRVSHIDQKETDQKKAMVKLLDGIAKLPDAGLEPSEIRDLSYWDPQGGGSKIPGGDEFSKAVSGLSDALTSKPPGDVQAMLGTLDKFWTKDSNAFAGAIKTSLSGSVTAARSTLSGLAGLAEPLQSGKTACDKLKSDAILMIRRKEMLVRTALSDWAADTNHILRDFETAAEPSKTKAIEALCADIEAYLTPIFAEASSDVGKVGEGVEKTRAVLLDLEADIEAVVARARTRVEQFSAGYDRDKPWSAERLNSFRAGIDACIGNVTDDVLSAIGEARQRLGVELNDVCQAAGGAVAKALSDIASKQAGMPKDVTSLKPAVIRLLQPMRAALEKLAPSDGSHGELAKLRTDVANSGANDTLKEAAGTAIDATGSAITALRTLATTAETNAELLDTIAATGVGELQAAVAALSKTLSDTIVQLADSAQALLAMATQFGDDAVAADFNRISHGLSDLSDAIADRVKGGLIEIGHAVDPVVRATIDWLDASLAGLQGKVRHVQQKVTPYFDGVTDVLGAVRDVLAPEGLLHSVIIEKVVRPVLIGLLSPLPDAIPTPDIKEFIAAVRGRMTALSEAAGSAIRALETSALEGVAFISDVCGAVFEGAETVKQYINSLAQDGEAFLNGKVEALEKTYAAVKKQIEDALQTGQELAARAASLAATLKAFDYTVRGLQNDLSRSMETARMYGDRVFDAVGRIGDGGAMALPSNVLKLYSAVSSAPELAALKADIDRIRSGFDELSDIIETTEAGALFNRMGDELKALGLTLPFDKIGDRLIPADLSNFDIGKVFGNFGGINLDSLFKGYKVPAGVRDAVRVTHDFDEAQARAWVQVDIDAPLPGRRSLFSLGIFQVDFVDMRLTGQVRLEASKDQDKVTQTGFGRIGTTIDVVTAGQSMVRFDKFGLNFTREKGLEVEFDPKNIRLNPSFKFIQDFLSTLFPDEAGGLEIVKQDNIPIGVAHAFVIPPMTLNFGTSGVSNISIENHFKLLAYPDFMIANRFNLSSIERPFIFSIFVIGGTGYVQIDAEYRPFDSQLMVSVEAGAGGSAALAFAVGPFAGQVFITLSGVMTYRKMIGKPGGGLSLSVVLVIAGQVDVCGIVSVGITLTLRMSYRDNGEVHGQGTLSVSIRISRFFTISARANVDYKLRGGKSETSVSGSVSGEVTDERISKAKQAVEQLQKASN